MAKNLYFIVVVFLKKLTINAVLKCFWKLLIVCGHWDP